MCSCTHMGNMKRIRELNRVSCVSYVQSLTISENMVTTEYTRRGTHSNTSKTDMHITNTVHIQYTKLIHSHTHNIHTHTDRVQVTVPLDPATRQQCGLEQTTLCLPVRLYSPPPPPLRRLYLLACPPRSPLPQQDEGRPRRPGGTEGAKQTLAS